MLQLRGRLVLSMELDQWLHTVQSIERVSVVPLSGRVAVESTRLPSEFHYHRVHAILLPDLVERLHPAYRFHPHFRLVLRAVNPTLPDFAHPVILLGSQLKPVARFRGHFRLS